MIKHILKNHFDIMKFTNHTAKEFINKTSLIAISFIIIVFSFLGYIKYIFSCNYLYSFSNSELISLLHENNNKIFLLTQSMGTCKSKEYTGFLIQALPENYYGHILIFKTSSLGQEANISLNKIYNKNLYYYDDGFGRDDNKFSTVDDAKNETQKTIKIWKQLYDSNQLD